jgi:DNA adenine methylase
MPLLATPFLKWAGGKAKLASTLHSYFPRRIGTYYEPFLGGGAVFWHLAMNRVFKNAVLNDCNKEVMDCYRVIRDFPDDLIPALQNVEAQYSLAPKPTFEQWKALDPVKLDPVSRAVRTILLNKTGFNGLFRTNKRGIFNVPWGKKAKVNLFNEERLRACSETLNKNVSLYSVDFTEAVPATEEDDLVYFDPPYVPTSKTANFTSYTDGRFTMDDQYRLAVFFKTLANKGVKVVLSNADMPEVRAIYDGFEMHEIQAARAINSDGEKRGPVGELIIVGRPARKVPFMTP